MTNGKMHADQIEVDEKLVKELLGVQFPEWQRLPIEKVLSTGTDNAMFRLGSDLVVRLPLIERAAEQVCKEHRWLPELAPRLPLAIPKPLGKGIPSENFAWHWSIYQWLPGIDAGSCALADLTEAAVSLGAFVLALRSVDAAGGPEPGEHNFGRGVPLALRDKATREAVSKLDGKIDTHAVLACWQKSLQAPPWERHGVWIHGDLQSGNLLIEDGKLCSVIDFGGLGVGDPACDLMPAWTIFSGPSREAFRRSLSADDATWMRARGWALSVALIALPYYMETNAAIVQASYRAIDAVLGDC